MTLPAAQDRLDALSSWRAEWRGLRVAVLGLSATGFAVADTLTELGAEVLVLAEEASEEHRTLVPLIGATLFLGPLHEAPAALVRFAPELVIASPGFAPDHPLILWSRSASTLWGDVELAWRVRDKVGRRDGTAAPWLLVTGTRGKTLTTHLAAAMLREAGIRPAPCGDNGVPILDAARDPGGFDAFVVDLSSRRLWSQALSAPAGQLVPHGAVCLNLGADPDTDWHGSNAAYRDAKALVYRNTLLACVYNKADAETVRMVEEADVTEGARAIGFDLGSPGPSDLGVVDGILVDRAFLDDRLDRALELSTLEELGARGLAVPHLVESVLAAAALARSLDAPPEAISAALASLEPPGR